MSNLIRWPLAALAVWGGVWYLYLFLLEQGVHSSVAMPMSQKETGNPMAKAAVLA